MGWEFVVLVVQSQKWPCCGGSPSRSMYRDECCYEWPRSMSASVALSQGRSTIDPRQLFRHRLVSSLPHCLQEGEVGDRDDWRDLSASARSQHWLPSENRAIDPLREVIAKFVCADGGEHLGRTEVIELRCHTLKNGPIIPLLALWAAGQAVVRGTTHAKAR